MKARLKKISYWTLIGFLIVFISLLAWVVANGDYYQSGKGLGYNLGLVGGLMMLMLLLYSVRKHIGFMNKLGKLKYWFRIHMMLGIVGPVLILFHTTFKLGSINATIAFYCMVLVASSGFIGRFVYTKIHKGLYGSKNTLKEVRELLEGDKESVKTKLDKFPKVRKWMVDFEHEALEGERNFFQGVLYFLSFDVRRMLLQRRCKQYILRHTKGDRRHEYATALAKLISHYLVQVQTVAQFKKFEQIFSAWHVLHIPLMFMMVATAIFHVIWVHMY
jgi:hypothetical protein